ncbi:MAG: hypothetical protein ABI790_01310 [Betaproteobacteria bacterium]
MKTAYLKANWKDNIAAATILIATMVAIVGTIGNSTEARAGQGPVTQQMDTIVVTAPRIEIARMDTIVVSASRNSELFVAAN